MKQEAPILETMFAASLALTAAVMAAPPVPPPVVTTSLAAPKPAEPCRTVFCPGDYPEAARRQRLEGTVVTMVEVDEGGKPLGCRVTTSSGHKLLDDATCPILLRRKRYDMVKTKAGTPVRQYVRQSIAWKIQ